MATAVVEPRHLLMAATLRKRKALQAKPWRQWLADSFASYTSAPFAERHVRFWEWLSSLEPGVRPRARTEVWPRGGGKSSTTELGVAFVGSQPDPPRHFVLYVSETQEQANLHVSAIAGMLERVGVQRAVNQYHASKGWTQTTIRAANGFNVKAFGLDSGMRGIKLDEFRPDLIVMDDIDGRHDTPETTRKKIQTLTTSILPTGSADCAVIIVQNKIHENSIVSQLCDGRADFLHGRIPAVVEKAVNDLEYERVIGEDGMPEYRITGGTPTWEGQNLATCERQMNDWGLAAFLREAQQEVDEIEGGLWDQARDIDPFRTTQLPREMTRIVVAIDPNTTTGNDEAGIIVAGTSYEAWGSDIKNFRRSDIEHGYLLEDATIGGGPKAWAEAAVTAYHKHRADAMVAEKNNGGDMIALTVATIPGGPPVSLVWASRGKITRAEPVQKLYEDGRIHHVGHFPELEKEYRTYTPPKPGQRQDSPNRMDAAVWAFTDLMVGGAGDLSDLDDYYDTFPWGR